MTPNQPETSGPSSRKGTRTPATPEPEDSRLKIYTLRLTKSERDELAAQAKSTGKKMSDYVRSRIFGYRLPKRQNVIDEETYRLLSNLHKEIRNLGVNINRLAHNMHLGFDVQAEEVQPNIQELKPLLETLRRTLVLKAQDSDDSDPLEAEWEDGDR